LPSLDFEREKQAFRRYYDLHLPHFEAALDTHVATLRELLERSGVAEVTKIEGRIKEREECIKKFQRKYQNRLEAEDRPYAIKDHLSDLIGIRVVCLYEDQIAPLSRLLAENFRLIEVTDKSEALERTEDSFGYKGLHLDLAPTATRGAAARPFEVQIRSLIQDAWSVLDHRIKYKKSIPSDLKRRINLLSALFELADREFKEIRNATSALLQQATSERFGDPSGREDGAGEDVAATPGGRLLNAFSFLRIVGHFFKEVEFADYKVDNFVQDILRANPECRRADLHKSLMEHLKPVRDYRDEILAGNPDAGFGPFTMIRHCLYRYDPEAFCRMLSRGPRQRFAAWLGEMRAERS